MKPFPDATTDLIWRSVFILLSALIAISIPWDLITGPTNIMGRVLNLSIIPAVLYICMLPSLARQLRAPRERAAMAAGAALILTGAFSHTFGMGDFLLPKLGLIALASGLVAGFGAYVLARDGGSIEKMIVIATMIGIVPIFSLPVILEILPSNGWRYWFMNVPGFTNVRAVGHVTAIAIAVTPPLFMVASIAASKVRTGLLFAFTAALWAVLFWSGSRAGLVALVVSLPLMAILVRLVDLKAIILSVCALGAGAGASALMPVPGNSFGIITRVVEQMPDQIRNGRGTGELGDGALDKVNAVASGRVEMWHWAIDRIMEKPLTGWGFLPMYEWKDNGGPPFAHSHNIVLEYALGLGIPVTLVLIATVLFVFTRGARAVRRQPTPWRMAVLSIAILLPVYSCLSGVLLSPYQIIYFTAALGLMFGLAIRHENADLFSTRNTDETVPSDDILATL